MKEYLRQLAKGNFIYQAPKLTVPEQRLSGGIAAGSVFRQSFVLSAAAPVQGLVWSGNTRVRVPQPAFSGTECRIFFEINTAGLGIGDLVSGRFDIVSSAGEAQVEYEYKMIGDFFETGAGRADNLFHFANLAQTAAEEAQRVFYEPQFKKVFLRNDRLLSGVYGVLCKSPHKAEAVEEFLIAAHKKMPVHWSVRDSSKSYRCPEADLQDCVTLVKSGWGYSAAKLETDASFIRLEDTAVTTDAFTGNRYELRYVLDRGRMHPGRNFGRIILRTFMQRLAVEIEVDCPGPERNLAEERAALYNLTREYLNYRMKKTDQAHWIGKSGQILDRIRGAGGDSPFFMLVQAQLYFAQNRRQEGGWLLERVRQELNADTDVLLYCYYLYVQSLSLKDSVYTASAAAKVKHYYENGQDDWRMLWLLFYLDPSYVQNQSIKLLRIKDACHNGCTSPVLYLEALTVLNAQPALLRVLNRFELQVLNFGCKYALITEKLALQASALIGGEKVASAPMLSVLNRLYCFYEKDCILNVLVTHMIRNELTGPDCFPLYEKGVLRGLRITLLYEYYIKSMDHSKFPRLPKTVLLYFAYDSGLDYASKAYLFANILTNEKNASELMHVYRPQMERFAGEQLCAKHVNGPLLTVYQNNWDARLCNEQTGEFMSRITFTYKVTCFVPDLKYVLVWHKELNRELRYPILHKTAYIQMYTENCAVLFEDSHGVCRKDSLQYEIERVFADESLTDRLFQYNTQDVYLRLYMYENRKKLRQSGDETVANIRWLMRCPLVSDETKAQLNSELIGYYAACYAGEDFGAYFSDLQKEGLAEKDAVKLTELCVHQGLYEEAFNLVKDYSCEQMAPVEMFRLARHMLELRGMEEDPVLLALCSYDFKHKKYHEEILQYLNLYFNGTNEEMYYIWKACRNFKVPCQSFAERLIAQMLFTGEHNGRLTEVFGFYYSDGGRNAIIRAYIAYHANLYFVHGKKVNEIVFRVLQKELQEEENWLDVCKLALLKYYAGQAARLSETQKKTAGKLLETLCSRNVFFDFYKKFSAQGLLPYNALDQTVVEYRTDPSAKVEIHYRVNGETASEQTAVMRCCGGVFIKNFTLFYGDSLQYYFIAEWNGKTVRSEEMNLLCSHINPDQTEGRFDYLNDMLASRELHDMVTMKKLMQGYAVQDYVGSQLFKRW